MKSKVRVMHKNEFERNRWAGGVTTQLAIWPEEAHYPAGPSPGVSAPPGSKRRNPSSPPGREKAGADGAGGRHPAGA